MTSTIDEPTTGPPGALAIDRQEISMALPAGCEDLMVEVYLEGRRIWTTRTSRGEWRDDGRWHIDWPRAMHPRLVGTGAFAVELGPRGDRLLAESVTVTLGGSTAPLALDHPMTGSPQVINKWGRVAKSFEDKDDEFFDALLASTREIADFLGDECGIEAFLHGGSLLGPVRDGDLIPYDDDSDLAYLSEHQNPTDIALESYGIERRLREAGYDLVRHSTGHIQVMFPGHSMIDRYYVDIFTCFLIGDRFYTSLHACEPAGTMRIHPLGTMNVRGHELPVPADPTTVLLALYGPGWATPDPSYRYETPPQVARRYYWWQNHFDAHREDWEDFWRCNSSLGSDMQPSDFAVWAAERLTDGASVYEMGCGDGLTACHLAADRAVLGSDYARPALALARERAARAGVDVRLLESNQYSARQISHALREAASFGGPVDVVIENLFDGMHFLGWDGTMRVMRRLLDLGGAALVGVGGGCHGHAPAADEPPGDRFWGPQEFAMRIERFAMTIASVEIIDPRGRSPRYRYLIRKA
ncbi:LicD family protein [uncultured Propionibacterium sp.]|uniref:LicD family protein n=1 Tax=uncultured Propionibacterium sp. TaxID=218066 RepID=UPI00292D9F4A|nr:LicD family protein [uncultured Propionibacterium sp.]